MAAGRTIEYNRILNYHKIDTKKEVGITVVHPKAFEKQIEYLVRKGYNFITLSELFFNNNEKNIALSFDDGYQNIFRFAYPVLKKYSIPATVFIITNAIGKSNDWDANLLGIKFQHLNEKEIRELLDAGWEIGSHGIDHHCLQHQKEEHVYRDIGDSKDLLENQFNTKINFYSAPFGKINIKILEACKQKGYLGCCGFYPMKLLKQQKNDIFIPRLGVYLGETVKSVERKLSRDIKTLKWQVYKQNFINFWNNGTIIVNAIKEKLALKEFTDYNS